MDGNNNQNQNVQYDPQMYGQQYDIYNQQAYMQQYADYNQQVYQQQYVQPVQQQYAGQVQMAQEMQADDEFVPSLPFSRRILNPSFIVGMVGMALIIVGMLMPILDFTAFHENIDIQYNLPKVCKNVGLLSVIWHGLPYGILVGIILLFVLSFINIPALKITPLVLIITMLVIMLVDLNNVILWANDLIEKTIGPDVIIVNKETIMDGIMPAVYILISGIVVALISCFLPGGKEKVKLRQFS